MPPKKKSEQETEATESDAETISVVEWREYRLRKSAVSVATVNDKLCRVQELGEGYHSIEVDGIEPLVTEEPLAVCLAIAEKSALAGALVRRFIASDGSESYR